MRLEQDHAERPRREPLDADVLAAPPQRHEFVECAERPGHDAHLAPAAPGDVHGLGVLALGHPQSRGVPARGGPRLLGLLLLRDEPPRLVRQVGQGG